MRCTDDHLFTTIWIPFVSFKALRAGGHQRYQRCPVGGHWTLVERLDPATADTGDLEGAALIHDVRIP